MSSLHLNASENGAEVSEALLNQLDEVLQSQRGFRFSSFIFGAFFALSISGLVWYRFQATLHRAGRRNKQRQVAEALQNMDAEELSDLMGDTQLPAWATMPDFERTKWMNRMIRQIYPHLARMVSTWANENVDTLLKENAPGWVRSIRMTHFSMGSSAPQVTGVKVYDTEDIGGKNEMVMELDCTWHSDVEVGISVQPVPKAKIPVVQGAVLVDRAFNFLTSLIKVKASVQRLYLQGRVMVTLRPLMPAPPLVGSVQVAFAEVPDYSFDLLLFGGDTSVLPGLENFLYSVIKDNVLRQYTLPERFVLPLIPEDQLRADRPRGVLEVEIVEAENVPRMDLFSASDPYVRLFTRVGRQYSTQVVQNSKSPVWNERFMTLVHYPESQLATFILMDYDTFGKDDEIGRVEVKISELPQGQRVERWLEVLPPGVEEKRKQKKKGILIDPVGKAVQSSRKVVAKVVSPQSVATPNACRLHVFMTYQAFPTEQLDRACKAHMTGAAPTCEEALADNVSPNLRRLLTGGVLFVRVLSASDLDFSKKHKVLGGIGRKIKVKVRYGGQLKSTVALTGRHHTYAFDGELEFVVDGDQVAASEVIEVEVWDVHWRNALLGVGVIPFADVKKESTGLSVSLQLEGAKKGQVDLRCEWLGMMTGALEKAA